MLKLAFGGAGHTMVGIERSMPLFLVQTIILLLLHKLLAGSHTTEAILLNDFLQFSVHGLHLLAPIDFIVEVLDTVDRIALAEVLDELRHHGLEVLEGRTLLCNTNNLLR